MLHARLVLASADLLALQSPVFLPSSESQSLVDAYLFEPFTATTLRRSPRFSPRVGDSEWRYPPQQGVQILLALQRSPQRGIIAEVEPAGRIASQEVRIADNKQRPLNLNFLIIPFETANKKRTPEKDARID